MMPAKSFIGEMEEAARHFYATAMRGEVSDANVRGQPDRRNLAADR
jgi:hypothetical protein